MQEPRINPPFDPLEVEFIPKEYIQKHIEQTSRKFEQYTQKDVYQALARRGHSNE